MKVDIILDSAPESDLFADLTPSEKQACDITAKIAMCIFDARKNLGMSQKQFAKHLGVSQGMISKWESAEYNFTIEKLAALCGKLNLLFDVEIKEQNAVVNNKENQQKTALVSNISAF
jgi:transcriptional regulator with XRE-family HTH domain